MKKISIIFIAVFSLFFANCDNEFEKVNTDPNNPLAIPSHLLLGNILRINQNIVYGMQQGGDMGMCWAQHVSKVQYNDEEQYVPRRGSIDAIWNTLFASVIADAKTMYNLADSEGNDNLKAIALVLEANGFQILTDLYGPIPYNEVFQSGNLKPAYDSQEVVYQGILDKLTQAESLFATGNGGAVVSTSDIMYAGDLSKWRKLASSLKLKALMRISKVKDVKAELQALVNSGNLMSNTSDSAQITYLGSQPDANPIYETIVYGSRLEYKMSSILVDKLKALGDSRLEVMASPNDAKIFVGNIPGVENSGNYKGFSGLGAYYLNPTLPGVVLSYAQVEFYLAEAINEGLIAGTTASALAHYNKGIVSNFVFNGLTVKEASTYILKDVVTFTNPADAKVKIAEQMWISLFGQGFEAWSEWRRTALPVLLPVFEAETTTIPSRLYYNSNEISLNRANYTTAIGLLPGGDQLTSRLWWMN